MRVFRLLPCTLAGASLLSVVSLLAGCTGALTPQAASPAAIGVTGNWQFAAPASRLGTISGELTGSSAAMTGILHTNLATACALPAAAFDVSGSANAQNIVTLTGALAGGAVTISGTLAADGRSLTGATINVVGGSCATASASPVTAASYASITGAYTGTFADPGGQVIAITTNLTQTPASDTSGNFQLSGNAAFPNNPCFASPVSITSSQVTGGSFNLTYADSVTTNSVNALGTFPTDGKTLTVTQWTLTGPCGPDSGSGLLTHG